MNLQVMKAQRNHTSTAIYCKIPDTQHFHFADELLVAAGILKQMSLIKDTMTSQESYKNHIKIIDDYFALMVAKDKPEGSAKIFMNLHKGDKRFPFVKY